MTPVQNQQPVTRVLYLHGFRSSPQSMKARMFAAWMQTHRQSVEWICPQLPPSPNDAMALVRSAAGDAPTEQLAIIGSSLGGFYATVVAEARGCRAVLLNPAIDPARDLAKYIGETTAWHSDEPFYFRAEFVDELLAMTPVAVTKPERYFTVIAKGDEVLDWHEMSARYQGCPGKLLDGGDHALSDFDVHLPDVLRFIGLAD